MPVATSHRNLVEAAPPSACSAYAHADPHGTADWHLPAPAPTAQRSNRDHSAGGVVQAAGSGAPLPCSAFPTCGTPPPGSKFANAAGGVCEVDPLAAPPRLSPGQLFNPTRRGRRGSGQLSCGVAQPLAGPGLGEERSQPQRSRIRWASNVGASDRQAEALARQLPGERSTPRSRIEFDADSKELVAHTPPVRSTVEQNPGWARGPIRRSLSQASLRPRVSIVADSPPASTAMPTAAAGEEAASAPSQRARRVSSYLRAVCPVTGAEPTGYMMVCDRDAVMRAMQAVKERQARMLQRAGTCDQGTRLSTPAGGDACGGACALALSAARLPWASKQGACNAGEGQSTKEQDIGGESACEERGTLQMSQHPGHQNLEACLWGANVRPAAGTEDDSAGSMPARRRGPPRRQRSCIHLIHTGRQGDLKSEREAECVMLCDKETVERAIKMAKARRAQQRMLRRLQPLVAKLSPSGRATFLKVWTEPDGGKQLFVWAAAQHAPLEIA
uniref:Uncharacterized protein n=1 Tax=Chlamydomonas euryale TaxID=1486919 RepID=A0A7R9Z1Q2_9CHLO|mmetsp:Transcript_41065/g.122596  ORF Transcript_41065/g.122596 Transcript_41065/m.122596 type:complete len:502 (+) Transcript_41065:257-1762(+)